MTWDDIFTDFGAMYLNWDPTLMPVTVTRHWSWPKPIQPTSDSNIDVLASNPRFRLRIDSAPTDSEVWILVSQHIANKVRPLDDIALHVFEEHKNTSGRSKPRVALGPQKVEALKPYTNSSHILLRYTPRRPNIDLLVIPARDRGVYRTNFTLQAFAPSLTHLSLERISLSLPFTQSTSGSLTKRNSGGHPGWPSWMNNPQYRMMIAPQPRGNQAAMIHVVLSGEKEIPWHVMLLWGQGEIVFKRAPLLPHHQTLISVSLTQDMIIGDSGSHSYGMAYLDIPSLDRKCLRSNTSVRLIRLQLGHIRLLSRLSSPARVEPIRCVSNRRIRPKSVRSPRKVQGFSDGS